MTFRIGVVNPVNANPLLILMAAECETVADEMELEYLREQDETAQLEAQATSFNFPE